jgi:hypothetical protein
MTIWAKKAAGVTGLQAVQCNAVRALVMSCLPGPELQSPAVLQGPGVVVQSSGAVERRHLGLTGADQQSADLAGTAWL